MTEDWTNWEVVDSRKNKGNAVRRTRRSPNGERLNTIEIPIEAYSRTSKFVNKLKTASLIEDTLSEGSSTNSIYRLIKPEGRLCQTMQQQYWQV